ncbi:MAG: glycosyltransferase [Acidimicrobiia bacterium]|nr:glycosyltransferase [Acidimicrobiia bacterium]
MIRRVAYLSMHTTPLAQPGIGDAGGMNVYIDRLARTMAGRGIKVEVFTRRTDPAQPEDVMVTDGYKVVHIGAGPEEPLPPAELADSVQEFALGVTKWAGANRVDYDVVHSHYWLSGWAGVIVKQQLGVGLAHSFHTLGRIKDANRAHGQPPESLQRIATEQEVIEFADCVIASTPYEFDDLVEHYGTRPESICISPPGVDHTVFAPGPKAEARRRLGIEFGPILLFAGRIQPLKGVDVAIETLQVVRESHPLARLVVVGGPSGGDGEAEMAHLAQLAVHRGLGSDVVFRPPEAHDTLADFYRAADALLMPSRSESFGLVAAEAQAAGLPVVAANVGGLAYAVADGASGVLVDGYDPGTWAEAVNRVIDESGAFSDGAADHSERFSWDATADRLLELYSGIEE